MLANSYLQLGQPEKAIERSQSGNSLCSPKFGRPISQSWRALSILLNRFAEAKEVYERAIALNLDPESRAEVFMTLPSLAGTRQGCSGNLTGLAGSQMSPRDSIGKPTQQLLPVSGTGRKSCLVAQSIWLPRATPKRWPRNMPRMKRYGMRPSTSVSRPKPRATQALAIGRDRISLPRSGLGLALCGEAGQVQKLIDEMKERYPKDTFINGLWLPVIQRCE